MFKPFLFFIVMRIDLGMFGRGKQSETKEQQRQKNRVTGFHVVNSWVKFSGDSFRRTL
jgi:hypothetical protein